MNIKTIRKELSNHKNLLEKLMTTIENNLKDVPQGRLRVVTNRDGRTQYYIKDKDDKYNYLQGQYTQGKYLKKENIDLAYKIAQRDYGESLLKEVKKEYDAIVKFEKTFKPEQLELEYDNLSDKRKPLVEPWIKPLEDYINEWQNIEYAGKAFYDGEQKIYTEKGERVRSKSEKIIADKLFFKGIPYRYEYPLKIKGYGEIYPDFVCLNKAQRKEIYWEHMGMMSNAEYCKNAIKKINQYIKSGYKYGEDIIFTYESAEMPLDTYVIDNIIDTYLQ